MRILLLTALFIGSPLLAFGQEVKVLEKYQCRGVGQNGQYTTPLTIERNGENYILRWTDSYGEGFRYGDQLVVFYLLGSGHGAMLYQILDGRLNGYWMFEGDTKVYTEFCVAGILAKGGEYEQQDTEAPERPSAVRGA